MIPFLRPSGPAAPPSGRPRLTVTVPEAAADLVAAFLHVHAHGDGVLVRDEEAGGPAGAVQLVVWPAEDAATALVYGVEALFAALRETGGLAGVTHLELDEDPGAWERPRQVVRVAGRFVIARPWLSYEPAEGELLVSLDPGPDEDDGRHPATALALLQLARIERAGVVVDRILDVTCGSGILAIAAALVWPDAEVVALSNDDDDVALAKRNVARLGLDGRVAIRRAAAGDMTDAGAWSLAIARLSAGPAQALAPTLERLLRPGGRAVTAGYPRGAVDKMESIFIAHGLYAVQSDTLEDWAALTFVK